MARSTGTTTWIDYGTNDLSGTQRFYADLFGWEFEDMGEEMGHYHLIRKDGELVGGAMDVTGMTCPEGGTIPNAWGVFLAVDDVDARVRRVLEHGGHVPFPAVDAGSAGRHAIAIDPTGAAIGLWQAGQIEGFEFTGQPGTPVWFELMTHGFDAASDFYTAVVDAELVPMTEEMEDDSFRYVTNGPGEEASWGLGDATGVMPEDAAGWRIYLGVDGCDAAIERIRELGGSLLDGPVDSPFGRIATVAAPDGATFQICSMSEAVAES